MTTELLEQPDTTETNDDADGLHHFICDCDDNLAFCGADVTTAETFDTVAPESSLCVVCADLAKNGVCPRTGRCQL